MNIRRVDFYPDDWLSGTSQLTVFERGVYWTACALIYNQGGPIERAHLRLVCGGHGRPFNKGLSRLLALGKLIADGDMIDQARCERELLRAERADRERARKSGQTLGGM